MYFKCTATSTCTTYTNYYLKYFFFRKKKWEFQTLAKMFSREVYFIHFKKKRHGLYLLLFCGNYLFVTPKNTGTIISLKIKKVITLINRVFMFWVFKRVSASMVLTSGYCPNGQQRAAKRGKFYPWGTFHFHILLMTADNTNSQFSLPKRTKALEAEYEPALVLKSLERLPD